VRGQELRLTLRLLPRVTPPAIAASLSQDVPVDRPQPGGDGLEHQLLRFGLPTVAYDRDLRVVFSNAAARRLFGSTRLRRGREFRGGPFEELRPVVERLVTLAAPLRPTVVQVADGRAFRVHGLAASDADPAVLFVEDVSDEVQHDRVMREFLRNAAHQLRTPLAGITAAIETLQSGAKELPAERDRFLGHVQTHANRLSRIARGLLVLARAEIGETLALDVVQLGPLLDDLVSEAEPGEGVALRGRYAAGLAALAAPDLLREALAALVDNAIFHTESGEIVVGARQSEGKVVVTVADSGPGIPPEFHARIFQPFFRLGGTGEGFGLGLAIAAQAVQAMHGQIDVSSEVGAGATFIVSLPSATVAR
jgi:two-component system phosphate regulon sensor histidine kinase PhoR